MAGGAVSPASPGSHCSLFAHPIALFGSFPEDIIYILKPRPTLAIPPRHSAVSLPLARLAHELADAARDHAREPLCSMYEARDRAVHPGPFDAPYEIVRRLKIIFRSFDLIVGKLTMNGSYTGPFLFAMFGFQGVRSLGP